MNVHDKNRRCTGDHHGFLSCAIEKIDKHNYALFCDRYTGINEREKNEEKTANMEERIEK